MERKVKFAEGEYYHLYSRGVEKRKVFMNTKDHERFLALLYIMNQGESFRFNNFLSGTGNIIHDVFSLNRQSTLVSIISYSLLPNHFHLFVYEKQEGGISKFLMKVLTAYSMYFNIKNKRSGPLFVHPFRSVHIDNNAQFLHIAKYIHLNPLNILYPDWRVSGLSNKKRALSFLKDYPYSSYQDFLGNNRVQSKILDFELIKDLGFSKQALLTVADVQYEIERFK